MKRIILFSILLILAGGANAQLLFTDSNFVSNDNGATSSLASVLSSFHEAGNCRVASVYGSVNDPSTQQLKNNNYQALTYYDNGNLKQLVTQAWKAASSSYVNTTRVSYIYYGATAKKTSTLVEDWVGTAWRDSTLETETYNANGYLTDDLNQKWDVASASWKKVNETLYYNNSKGYPDSTVVVTYQNEVATNNTKYIFTYNASDTLVLQKIAQSFTNSQWINSTRTTNIYTNGYPTLIIGENYTNGQWQNTTRITSTYNERGKPLTKETESYSVTDQAWSFSSSQTIVYNADDNPLRTTTKIVIIGFTVIVDMHFTYQSCDAVVVNPGELCPTGSTTLTAGVTGATYRWQVNTGGGFVNVSNNGNYSGAATATLALSNIPSSWYGYQYRCVAGAQTGSLTTLKFVTKWTGATNNQWEVGSNWSCGTVPDANTDVIIDSGAPVLNSNRTVRSLTVNTGGKFTANTGTKLTITH